MDSLIQITNFVGLIGGTAGGNPGDGSLGPLYDAISLIGPYAIGIVLALWLVYAVIFGVKLSKAEDAKERAGIQKALINGIIGFLVVTILIVVLYAIREPLAKWMNS